MKQLFQQFDTGAVRLADVPVPIASGSNIVVETRASLVSAGTERMIIEFGRSNLLQKARAQPEKVAQVLQKIGTDGLAPTLDAVRSKLSLPTPLGYCQAGVVVEIGPRVTAFKKGDRVVTNGSHSEFVRVPTTLAARIPDGVSYEHAAFTPLAAIALQGMRLIEPTLGEVVVVYGLGLIGLLAVQLLRANGCRVIGIDRDPKRLALARDFGAETVDGNAGNVSDAVLAYTRGIGADAVLVTLASKSDEPMHESALMSRKRGRIVLVGVTGLQLQRDDFYRKELSFQVSCSYGPGRYDPVYEDHATDYPLPFVRWTEQRNFEAVLALMADGRLDPSGLISHRFRFDAVAKAYDLITSSAPSLGVVLQYGESVDAAPLSRAHTIDRRTTVKGSGGATGIIGAGNYAARVLLPAMQKAGLRIRTVASSGGTSGAIAGELFDTERTTTDVETVFADTELDSVFVVTRHDTHASFAQRALEAGKHVFVEKPLALTLEELDQLEPIARGAGRILTVGFNRRFAPLTQELSRHTKNRSGPLSIVATINAGSIPSEHWAQSREAGGGRIVGEAVHWMDLARALVGTAIVAVQVTVARDRLGQPIDDIAHLAMEFADGSTAVIHYLSSGAKSFPKERIDCFFDGKTIVIDNWRRLKRFGMTKPLFERTRKMDKGQDSEIEAWKRAVSVTGIPPIPLDELFEVSRWAVKAAELASQGGGSAR